MVAATAPGKKVDFKIIREGKEQTIAMTLGEYKEKKIVKKTEYNNVMKDSRSRKSRRACRIS